MNIQLGLKNLGQDSQEFSTNELEHGFIIMEVI